MNVPKIRPVKNQQVETNKFGQDINYLRATLNQPLESGSYIYEVKLGARDPAFKNSPDYLSALATSLSELGFEGCQVDLEASHKASMIPNPYGYGNERIQVWDKDHHVLVVSRQVMQATVHLMPIQEMHSAIAA
jgi:hypothetical protein